jgi:hypothetical protein
VRIGLHTGEPVEDQETCSVATNLRPVSRTSWVSGTRFELTRPPARRSPGSVVAVGERY